MSISVILAQPAAVAAHGLFSFIVAIFIALFALINIEQYLIGGISYEDHQHYLVSSKGNILSAHEAPSVDIDKTFN